MDGAIKKQVTDNQTKMTILRRNGFFACQNISVVRKTQLINTFLWSIGHTMAVHRGQYPLRIGKGLKASRCDASDEWQE